MVRKVDISSTVGPCTAAVLWAACYGDAQATREYHLRVNKDPSVEVGPWQDGVRHVHFCMPLNAPDWVKRTVGIDSVRVRETQVVLWHNERSFTVRSDTTVLNVPGAARFQTSLQLAVSERPDEQALAALSAAPPPPPPAQPPAAQRDAGGAAEAGSSPTAAATTSPAAAVAPQPLASPQLSAAAAASVCEVLFTVKCSAGMPWPLGGSIENIMADKAQASMQDYLAYCQERVDGALVAAAAQQGGVQPSSLEVQEGVGGLLQRLSQAGSTVGELSLLPGLGTDRLGSVLGGGGVLGSLPSRARRWPSVAVTTYPQGLEDLDADMARLQEAEAAAAGGDESEVSPPTLVSGGASVFADAQDTWLSPAASLASAGALDGDAEHAPHGLHVRPGGGRRTTSTLHAAVPGGGGRGGPSGDGTAGHASTAAALAALTVAVQALDRKLGFISSQFATDPVIANANRRAWGNNSPRRAVGAGGGAPGGTSPRAPRQPFWRSSSNAGAAAAGAGGGDVEAGAGAAAGGGRPGAGAPPSASSSASSCRAWSAWSAAVLIRLLVLLLAAVGALHLYQQWRVHEGSSSAQAALWGLAPHMAHTH